MVDGIYGNHQIDDVSLTILQSPMSMHIKNSANSIYMFAPIMIHPCQQKNSTGGTIFYDVLHPLIKKTLACQVVVNRAGEEDFVATNVLPRP